MKKWEVRTKNDSFIIVDADTFVIDAEVGFVIFYNCKSDTDTINVAVAVVRADEVEYINEITPDKEEGKW